MEAYTVDMVAADIPESVVVPTADVEGVDAGAEDVDCLLKQQMQPYLQLADKLHHYLAKSYKKIQQLELLFLVWIRPQRWAYVRNMPTRLAQTWASGRVQQE